MKLVYVCFVVFSVVLVLPGCGSKSDNAVITDGLTADDFAKYEADLAAANSQDAYDDQGGDE